MSGQAAGALVATEAEAKKMAFIEIFWATYAPLNLLIALLKAGPLRLIRNARPVWRVRQHEVRPSSPEAGHQR
jgi:hypothetical protein